MLMRAGRPAARRAGRARGGRAHGHAGQPASSSPPPGSRRPRPRTAATGRSDPRRRTPRATRRPRPRCAAAGAMLEERSGRARPTGRAPAAHARRRRSASVPDANLAIDLGARRVRDARGAGPRSAAACTCSSSATTSPLAGRGRAQAAGRPPAAPVHGTRLRHRVSRRRRPRLRQRRAARARRLRGRLRHRAAGRGRRGSPRSARASRTASASAAAISRAEVGGTMTDARARRRSPRDAATEAIVVISKPPAPSVLPRARGRDRRGGQAGVVCCLGAARDAGAPGTWVGTLDDAADAVVALLRGRAVAPRVVQRSRDACARALARSAAGAAGPARRSTPAARSPTRRAVLGPAGARLGNVGAAATARIACSTSAPTSSRVGRPHPMIDPAARAARVREAGARSATSACCSLDLVLGRAAHPDPAAALADAVRDARRAAERRRPLAARRGVGRRHRAPIRRVSRPDRARSAPPASRCLPSNAEAARFAALALTPRWLAPSCWRAVMTLDDVLGQPLRVINLGLEVFAERARARRRHGGSRRLATARRRRRRPSGAPG